VTKKTKTLLLSGALGAAALAYACTLTDVTGVVVGQVSIQPPSVTILEGATVQLSAQAQDQLGDPLPVGAVVWSVANPSIVTISSDGLVEALQAGQTQVTATLEGVSATAPVTVTPGPRIATSVTSLSFFGGVGPTPPAAQTVAITNAGGGTLGGLDASVQYPQGGASDWLDVGLSRTTAPANLTVSVLSGSLAQGVYNATISVSSDDARNSPVTISVQLELTLQQPVIAVNPSSLEFEVEEGTAAPEPKIVQITNAGGGVLTGLQALVAPGSWLSADLTSITAPTQLSLTPDPSGLAVGTYDETVLIRSGDALNEGEVDVTLRILPAPVADVGVAKTGPSGASTGDTVVFVVTTTNAGPNPARDVVVVDSLPSGLTFQKASGGASRVGSTLTWTLGTVAAGSTVVDSIWTTAPGQGTFQNVARVSSSSVDPGTGNDRDTHTVQVVPVAANLQVQKTGPATGELGGAIDYSVGVVNGGPNTADNVVLVDSLPAGVEYVSSTGGASVDGRALRWEVGSLEAGEDFSATVTVNVTATGTLINVLRVSSDTFDPVPANNRTTATTSVGALADLAIAKTGPTAAEAGDTIEFVISVVNNGPSAAANVLVLDSLPGGLAFVSGSGSPSNLGSGVIAWSRESIESGASLEFRLRAVASATGTVTNVARLVAGTGDPEPEFRRRGPVGGEDCSRRWRPGRRGAAHLHPRSGERRAGPGLER
jgi:uncharacterized repeat protein (TIGR01451 family)